MVVNYRLSQFFIYCKKGWHFSIFISELHISINHELLLPIQLILPESFCESYQKTVARHQPTPLPPHAAQIFLEGSLEVGHLTLSLQEIQSLRVGDYILYQGGHGHVGTLSFEQKALFYAKKESDHLLILDKVRPMDETFDAQETHTDVEKLPLTISVEALRFELPVERVLSLKEGDLIEEVPLDLNAPLKLSVRGKIFAEAELVEKQGRTLLRILSLTGAHGQNR